MKPLTSRKTVIPSENRDQNGPKIIGNLTAALCFYLAAPLWDVPFVGLSLSALILFFLVFEVFRHLGGLRVQTQRTVFVLLGAVWFCQLLSLAVNVMGDNISANFSYGLTTLLRYAFWFLVMMVSVRLFTFTELSRRAAFMFGFGVLSLSFICLFEYFFLGGLKESGWSNITSLSQNGYGWQFSAFVPYSLYLAMTLRGRKRPLAGIGFIAVLLAVILNGSRSSWVTVSFGLLLFVLLWLLSIGSVRKTIRTVMLTSILAGLAAGLFTIAPEALQERFFGRVEQSRDLSRDKSWQIRLLMIQKGIRLFEENPIFGVGPGQFRYTHAEIELPSSLLYERIAYFNEKSAHNSYIQLLAEGGLALVFPLCLLLVWLAFSGFKATIALARQGETWWIPAYTGFICFSIHFWSLAGITSTAPWFIYGFIASAVFRAKSMKVLNKARNNANYYGIATRVPLSRAR